MGVTLEQLLNDDVGIEKTASVDAPPVEADLVDALRKYAEDDNVTIREQAAQELTEKTAEIVVIHKALEEINKVASLGVASNEQKKLATFIKVALDKGHSEEEIAEFLQKEAILGTIGAAAGGAAALHAGAKGFKALRGGIKRLAEKRKFKKIQKRERKTRGLEQQTTQELRKNIHDPKYLEHYEATHGAGKLKQMLEGFADEGMKLPKATKKYMPETIEEAAKAPKKWGMTTPGGKEFGATEENVTRYGIPAGAALGGYALSKGVSGPRRDKSGVVVVNR